MKILIIGKNSYIGDHLDQWLVQKGMNVIQLDPLNEDWKSFDYSSFTCVIHVAGIVHRPDCHDWTLYKEVNTDMPIFIANRAKSQGVKSFIFFSSMSVFGKKKELKPTIIDENTPRVSDTMYGKSKLMAEDGLFKLQDDNFNIVIVRPPSVYGKGCKGGYISGFKSVVQKLPLIPLAYTNIKQSMLYIDNLSEFIYQAIIHNLSGGFCPQDDISVSANEITSAIALGLGKSPHNSIFLGYMVRLFHFIPFIKKAYGGIEYSKSLSCIDGINYVVVPFNEGMKRTVN